MTAISPVGSAASDIRMPYPVELEKPKEISPEEKAKKEQEKRQNRFKSALKCGGTAAGAVIAGNVIFFNKSWKGKGNKIPSTVKALYNGLLGGALIGTGYHAGIWDKLPPKQTIGYTLSIEPIKELAEIAHIHGAFFHTDAVQAVGHIPVNVTVLGIDMLSASAHKFNGPKGTGFLYIRKGTDIHSLVDGGAQEFGMRAGTENIAAIVAMAEALRKNCAHMDETESRLCKMENSFIHALNKAGIDFIRNGADNHLPGNISISIKNASGEMLLHRLDLKGICISTGSACDSVNTQVSHVIQAISVPEDYAAGTIRISFGRDNQESDAQDIADAIVSILKN